MLRRGGRMGGDGIGHPSATGGADCNGCAAGVGWMAVSATPRRSSSWAGVPASSARSAIARRIGDAGGGEALGAQPAGVAVAAGAAVGVGLVARHGGGEI